MDIYLEGTNWILSLWLIALTLTIHAIGVVTMALTMVRIRVWVEIRNLAPRYVVPIVVSVIGATGFLLALLHGIEAAIWAAVYLWIGALDSPFNAMLYSVDSMTTLGASGLTLRPHWQMMGALEAANGVLLFGMSTAYMFAIMQSYWPALRPRSR